MSFLPCFPFPIEIVLLIIHQVQYYVLWKKKKGKGSRLYGVLIYTLNVYVRGVKVYKALDTLSESLIKGGPLSPVKFWRRGKKKGSIVIQPTSDACRALEILTVAHLAQSPPPVHDPSMDVIEEDDASTCSSAAELPDLLRSSQTVLALVGAGLSKPSGLPTFRGEGARWRGHASASLAKRSMFIKDPCLVWQFYETRRKMAMVAYPNAGHFALAQLARSEKNFLAITQNIDGKAFGHSCSKVNPG